MQRHAQELYEIEGGCYYDPVTERWNNNLCITADNTTIQGNITSHLAEDYALWSHYGHSGPFTNSEGKPLKPPMKCICNNIDKGTSPADVDYYTVAIYQLMECFQEGPGGIKNQGVRCDGSFSFTPQGGVIESYEAQSVDTEAYQLASILTQAGAQFASLLELSKLLYPYFYRTGFTEWPNVAKFPESEIRCLFCITCVSHMQNRSNNMRVSFPLQFVIQNLDTCAAKGIVPVPLPVLSFTPYFFTQGNPTVPPATNSPLQLCAPYNLDISFCPSHDNPLMKPIKEWVFSYDDPESAYALFFDGSTMNTTRFAECRRKCPVSAEGTSYIVPVSAAHPFGIAVDYVTPAPTSAPTPGPTCAKYDHPCRTTHDCCDGLKCNKHGKCKHHSGMMGGMMKR